MNLSKIQDFKDWLTMRGRDPETAEGYALDIKLSYVTDDPLIRLRNPELAPKTKRRTMAALRAWCKFNKDNELLEKLMDFRLPPPERKITKVPLSREEWEELIDEVDKASYIAPNVRAALGIMAVRGTRVGDVLRMTREELVRGKASGYLIYEGKRKKRYEISIKPILEYVDVLLKSEGWKHVRDLISLRSKGKDSTKQSSAAQQVSRALKLVGEKIGIPPEQLHPHRLRRTYAVEFLKATGGDIVKLQSHMQWATINVAAGYVDHDRRSELDAISDGMRPKKK